MQNYIMNHSSKCDKDLNINREDVGSYLVHARHDGDDVDDTAVHRRRRWAALSSRICPFSYGRKCYSVPSCDVAYESRRPRELD